MRLVDVYSLPERVSTWFLFDLLRDRPKGASISHRHMPTLSEHVRFIDSRPYKAWYLVEVSNEYVGAVYLTHRSEIGIHIRTEHHGSGYGPAAVTALMEKHGPQEYLANVNPTNERSMRMFERLGFTHIQNTFRRKNDG